MAKKSDPKIFPLRTVVLLLIAVIAGLSTGALTYFSNSDLAAAVLAGLGGFAATLIFLDKVVD